MDKTEVRRPVNGGTTQRKTANISKRRYYASLYRL